MAHISSARLSTPTLNSASSCWGTSCWQSLDRSTGFSDSKSDSVTSNLISEQYKLVMFFVKWSIELPKWNLGKGTQPKQTPKMIIKQRCQQHKSVVDVLFKHTCDRFSSDQK